MANSVNVRKQCSLAETVQSASRFECAPGFNPTRSSKQLLPKHGFKFAADPGRSLFDIKYRANLQTVSLKDEESINQCEQLSVFFNIDAQSHESSLLTGKMVHSKVESEIVTRSTAVRVLRYVLFSDAGQLNCRKDVLKQFTCSQIEIAISGSRIELSTLLNYAPSEKKTPAREIQIPSLFSTFENWGPLV